MLVHTTIPLLQKSKFFWWNAIEPDMHQATPDLIRQMIALNRKYGFKEKVFFYFETLSCTAGKAGETNSAGLLTESLLMSKSSYPTRILVNYQRKLINISVDTVLWVEAQGDYAKLHAADAVYLSNYGISTLEEKLDPQLFIRVHRSAIINLKQIRELVRSGKSYDVTMNNGDVIRVSLGYLGKLRELMF